MGEIADMMIEGIIDDETGEYIEGGPLGYPASVHRKILKELNEQTKAEKKLQRIFPCPKCKRKLKTKIGIQQHINHVHNKPRGSNE